MRRQPFDIRAYKRGLREQYKTIRRQMEPEAKRIGDARIRGRILHMPEYRACTTLLCFVSIPGEVDTHKLIRRAIADGKIVAVPYCIDGTRKMNFYRIRSLEELTPRTFGVLEPDPEIAERVTDFSHSLCILPGLAFDNTGYRLGYGGGYYDRFLSKIYRGSGGVTAGICYGSCIAKRLPRGRFDMPCDILVTEKYARRLTRREERKNGAPHAGA